MLVGRDPAALLALAAGRALRLTATDELRKPARQQQATRARVLVNKHAVRETAGRERRPHLGLRLREPRRVGFGVHLAASGASPTASSSALSAAWHTCSRSCEASTMRKRFGAVRASSRYRLRTRS